MFEVLECSAVAYVCQSWGHRERRSDGSGGQPAHKLQGDLVRDWYTVLVCVVCI